MNSILPGRIKTIDLNNRKVRVIAPRKLVDYETGVKEINKILKKFIKM